MAYEEFLRVRRAVEEATLPDLLGEVTCPMRRYVVVPPEHHFDRRGWRVYDRLTCRDLSEAEASHLMPEELAQEFGTA